MEEPLELTRNRHWRTAVWALRIGYGWLVVALIGVVVLESGVTPWVLAVAVIGWLCSAATTLVAFFRARAQLARPRPGYWAMRLMIIRDTMRRTPPSSTSP